MLQGRWSYQLFVVLVLLTVITDLKDPSFLRDVELILCYQMLHTSIKAANNFFPCSLLSHQASSKCIDLTYTM